MERSVSDAIKHGMNKLGYQNIRENQRHAVEANGIWKKFRI